MNVFAIGVRVSDVGAHPVRAHVRFARGWRFKLQSVRVEFGGPVFVDHVGGVRAPGCHDVEVLPYPCWGAVLNLIGLHASDPLLQVTVTLRRPRRECGPRIVFVRSRRGPLRTRMRPARRSASPPPTPSPVGLLLVGEPVSGSRSMECRCDSPTRSPAGLLR